MMFRFPDGSMLRRLLSQAATKALPAIEIGVREHLEDHRMIIAAVDAANLKRARRMERNRKLLKRESHGLSVRSTAPANGRSEQGEDAAG